MSNKAERLVPALQFPEFQKGLGWEPKTLGEVATFAKGKGISKADISENGSLPCVRYGELYTRYGETIDKIYSYTNIPADDLVLSHANDVIIPASGETEADIATASCVLRAGVALGSDLNIIRSKFNGVFLSYYLNSSRKHAIAKLAQGFSVVHLYSSQLKKLHVAVPQVSEQKKIADCLSFLDDLIIAQAKKIEALKAHKKGLMQQLFPAEGETVPRFRFPEFQGAPEWKEAKLGVHIEEFQQNSTVQDQFEVLTSARTGLIRQREYFDNDRIAGRDNVGFNIIPPGHLTYRSRSDDRRFYFNENLRGITGIISTYYPVFRVINGYNRFFVELLSQYADVVGKYSVGTSQTVLSLNELKRIKFPLPSGKEQKKSPIALFQSMNSSVCMSRNLKP
ncbi:MAG: restriction endonuclease subunit S [Candidatus Accumulibacter sp.]|uniref:restriction endonuclease subunit S n=1 Tax=Accumulibacter sp. TaxID=2053492 RepID=UPI001AC0CA38|nr:restriction endonuclease subunit S [Accumulibacter sp.]MBN8519201.1 restriction endonuclease subunit S [Accumulibacter sp.]MBO3709096.1 restriction endonuclease subunit S [Accumulibacter sp.]